MTQHPLRALLLSIATLVAAAPMAHAGDDADFDINPKFRAKIAKEKAKQAASQNVKGVNGGAGASSSDCGSQNIGNVEAGGIGRGPREVFVFAPNTINLVSGNGCK
jgi:hypothetical protein